MVEPSLARRRGGDWPGHRLTRQPPLPASRPRRYSRSSPCTPQDVCSSANPSRNGFGSPSTARPSSPPSRSPDPSLPPIPFLHPLNPSPPVSRTPGLSGLRPDPPPRADDSSAGDFGLPLDTTSDAHARQRDLYRRMGGAARLAIAFELIETVRHTALAGILARHPAYTAEDLRLAWARLTLGDDLCRAVWPDRPLVEP